MDGASLMKSKTKIFAGFWIGIRVCVCVCVCVYLQEELVIATPLKGRGRKAGTSAKEKEKERKDGESQPEPSRRPSAKRAGKGSDTSRSPLQRSVTPLPPDLSGPERPPSEPPQEQRPK